jgi:hypothetical protein
VRDSRFQPFFSRNDFVAGLRCSHQISPLSFL